MLKKPVAILSSLLLTAFLATGTDAAVMKKNVEVIYNNIKIKHNGVVVPTDIEPFIINGTTYIPVRMMAGVFNKDVAWDGTTYTVSVTDRVDPQITALQAELARKDQLIKDKDARIAQLERQLRDYEEDDDDEDVDDRIADLEDDLNQDYGDFEDLEWEISLDGDEDDIEVEIEIDLDEYGDEFDNLSSSDIEDLVIDICDDIWNEFEDADIEGYIIDSAEDEIKYDFTGDASSGDIELDGDLIN